MTTILITGGNSGIGLEAVRNLARENALELILAGRNLDKMDELAEDLMRNNPARIRTVKMDVSSLASVREGAAQIRRWIGDGEIGKLDAIACNAGIQSLSSVSYSPDGYEETFATNFLGHFLMVNLLLDEVAENGRIVFTASGTHDSATMDGKMVGKTVAPDAVKLARTGKDGNALVSGGTRYTTSKLCVMLLAYELNRRLRQSNSSLQSIAFDPGYIPETGLARSAPQFAQAIVKSRLAKWLAKRLGVTMSSVSFSGASLAEILVSPDFRNSSVKYLQAKDGKLREARSSETSYDTAFAARLWTDAERLAGIGQASRQFA